MPVELSGGPAKAPDDYYDGLRRFSDYERRKGAGGYEYGVKGAEIIIIRDPTNRTRPGYKVKKGSEPYIAIARELGIEPDSDDSGGPSDSDEDDLDTARSKAIKEAFAAAAGESPADEEPGESQQAPYDSEPGESQQAPYEPKESSSEAKTSTPEPEPGESKIDLPKPELPPEPGESPVDYTKEPSTADTETSSAGETTSTIKPALARVDFSKKGIVDALKEVFETGSNIGRVELPSVAAELQDATRDARMGGVPNERPQHKKARVIDIDRREAIEETLRQQQPFSGNPSRTFVDAYKAVENRYRNNAMRPLYPFQAFQEIRKVKGDMSPGELIELFQKLVENGIVKE